MMKLNGGQLLILSNFNCYTKLFTAYESIYHPGYRKSEWD